MVVFTQSDRKWGALHGAHIGGDVISAESHQLTNRLLRGHALEWKEIVTEANESAGPDTIAERVLRFAMLRGLTISYRH